MPKHFYFLFCFCFPCFLPAQCPDLIWADEFAQSTLDLSKWSYMTGDGCDINLCGWGNNELQWYQAENVEINNGTLRIIAKEEQVNESSYTSARIRTIGQGDWTYGRFEASIKLPTGQGLWPAFWMLPTNEVYGGWPRSGEIDIMELVGNEPATVHGTIHYGQPWPDNAYSGNDFKLVDGIFNDEFHLFAVEWEAGEIRWMVDDYLYSTKTVADVSPENWPFDKDFHFLLNVAVGGTWPGAPNASTVFPQTMEVDYVRVYDGFFPSITGQRVMEYEATGITYTVQNAPAGSSFDWTLPAGATIVSGAGTHEIVVDWGAFGGTVTVVVGSDCETHAIDLEVQVKEQVALLTSLENFDDDALITYTFSTGIFEDNVANPVSDMINGSALAGYYAREASNPYDVLVYTISAIEAEAFVDGTRKFFIDIYTDAPIGTELTLQLEDNTVANGGNYPAGRHSRFQASTTVQNEWQRLEFSLLDQPDSQLAASAVNQLVFLFAPNTLTGYTFYLDNFDTYTVIPTSIENNPNSLNTTILLKPNPFDTTLQLTNHTGRRLSTVQVFDLSGTMVFGKNINIDKDATVRIDLSVLPAGVYHLIGKGKMGNSVTQKIVKR